MAVRRTKMNKKNSFNKINHKIILFYVCLYFVRFNLVYYHDHNNLIAKFRGIKKIELLYRGTMNFKTSFISQEGNISIQYRTGCVLSFVGISDEICVDDDGIVIATGKL